MTVEISKRENSKLPSFEDRKDKFRKMAFNHPIRRRLIGLIDRPRSEILKELNIDELTLNHHIKILKRSNLI